MSDTVGLPHSSVFLFAGGDFVRLAMETPRRP
jgi:hypothetical protein